VLTTSKGVSTRISGHYLGNIEIFFTASRFEEIYEFLLENQTMQGLVFDWRGPN
jgi:hypothetical protein